MFKNIIFPVFFVLIFLGWPSYSKILNKESRVRYKGEYKVPVQEEQLYPFSSFIMKIKIHSTDHQSFLSYDLPIEISGRSIDIDMKIFRNENGFELQGPLGHGECTQKFSQVICKMSYNENLNLNQNEIHSYLESVSQTTAELEKREAVAQQFSVDPIGILSFEWK